MMTMEQELSGARHEILELKETLLEREKEVKKMENDMNFHILKSEEMEDLLEANSPNDHQRQLQMKILQNAGLTVQLQGMKDQLDESSAKQNSLEKELWNSQETVRRLSEDRRSHQRMIIEMSDVVRMLGQIDVEYDRHGEASSWSNPERSLDNIKMKIMAIEEDRQRLLTENQDLQTELFEKSIDLNEYQGQQEHLDAAMDTIETLKTDNHKLKTESVQNQRIIQSLEAKLGIMRKNDFPIQNVQISEKSGKDESDVETVLQCDGSTVVVPSTTSLSRVTNDPAHLHLSPKRSKVQESESDAASFSSLDSPSPADQVLALQKELAKAQKKCKTAKKKQELREKLLRDVIFQYKVLQKEHDDATNRLVTLDTAAGSTSSTSGRSSRHINMTKKASETHNGEFEEVATLDTTEVSSGVNTFEGSVTSTTYVSDSAQEDVQYCMPSTEDDFCRLEKECARLEHEYEDAVARIANLEEDLASAKKECEELQLTNASKKQDISDLQLKYDMLEADYEASVETTKRLESDLITAQGETADAHKKREERELDLWDVIDQYKHLAEESENTIQKMQCVESKLDETNAMKKSVEHELGLTKRHMKRNDLVYDNIRMEQKIQDYAQNIESLERQLKQARSEAARNKEDTKCIRKLLNGCNHNFRQLQSRYDSLVKEQETIAKAQHRAQRMAHLNEKMSHMRKVLPVQMALKC